MKSKIVFVHLLNDYSGSPKVLSQVIDLHLKANVDCQLLVGAGGDGFLNKYQGMTNEFIYRRSENRLVTLMFYLLSQVSLFYKVFRIVDKNTIVYINTMLPFGAALAAKIRNVPVIYHIHETSIRPALLKNFLKRIISLSSTKNIYVSNYLMESELVGENSQVVYNSVDSDYIVKGSVNSLEVISDFNVFMACSLKEYKGVNEFLEIAEKCKSDVDINFILVLNATDREIQEYQFNCEKPDNVKIYCKQNDLTSFYSQAHLVLNLSNTEEWIETFGLTLLESMAFGVPVIAPPQGGPVEIVENGVNGYLMNSKECDAIARKIIQLSKDKELMSFLSINAKATVGKFSVENFSNGILNATQKINC